MKQANLTVKELKDRIKDLPDDMNVIIPVIAEDNANCILTFRYVRTMGVISNPYEQSALCLNSAQDDLNIDDQLKKCRLGSVCDKILF